MGRGEEWVRMREGDRDGDGDGKGGGEGQIGTIGTIGTYGKLSFGQVCYIYLETFVISSGSLFYR